MTEKSTQNKEKTVPVPSKTVVIDDKARAREASRENLVKAREVLAEKKRLEREARMDNEAMLDQNSSQTSSTLPDYDKQQEEGGGNDDDSLEEMEYSPRSKIILHRHTHSNVGRKRKRERDEEGEKEERERGKKKKNMSQHSSRHSNNDNSDSDDDGEPHGVLYHVRGLFIMALVSLLVSIVSVSFRAATSEEGRETIVNAFTGKKMNAKDVSEWTRTSLRDGTINNHYI
jgi:hypothetical protein